MDDRNRWRDVLGSVSDLSCVVFNLKNWNKERESLHRYVNDALRNPEVRMALNTAQRQDAAIRFGATALDIRGMGNSEPVVLPRGPVIDALKKSAMYQEASKALKNLQYAALNTPSGVWVDENKNWLILVAAVAVPTAGAALYRTRRGDNLGKLLARGVNAIPRYRVLGDLHVRPTVGFQPAAHAFDVNANIDVQALKPIQLLFEVGAGFADEKLQRYSVKGSLSFPFGENVASLSASYDMRTGAEVATKVGVGLTRTFGGASKSVSGTAASSLGKLSLLTHPLIPNALQAFKERMALQLDASPGIGREGLSASLLAAPEGSTLDAFSF